MTQFQEPYTEYLQMYWGQEQMNMFDDVIRMWRWIIGYNLDTIFDGIIQISSDMPLVHLVQQETGETPTVIEINSMLSKYPRYLEREYPIYFNRIISSFSARKFITPVGLRDLVFFIDQGRTSILNNWNDNYFNELELNTL